jgi:hypothetical protein
MQEEKNMKKKDTAFIIIGAVVMAAVNVLFFTAPV